MTTSQSAATAPWLASYPDGIDWAAPISEEPLTVAFDRTVASHGEWRCIDFLGKMYSYREIGALVNRAAKGLQELGVSRGVNVGLLLPNTPYYVICYYAILKAGGTVVNFNPLYVQEEIDRQVEDSQIRIMVTLDLQALLPKASAARAKTGLERVVVCSMAQALPFPKNLLFPVAKRKDVARMPKDDHHLDFAALIANDGGYEPVQIRPREDVAVLQYTGGTTGVSKGAMLTHANIAANARQLRIWNSEAGEGQERTLAVLPFFHVFAMTVAMNQAVLTGAEMILLPRFELDAALKLIHSKRPTMFPGVPTIYNAINHHPALDRHDLSSIKLCISGGAPLPREVRDAFEKRTGCSLVEGYGLTEASPVVTCNPLRGEGKPGSIGLPIPGTTVEIHDMDNPGRTLPPGEKGEICVRGPQVMAGYWNRPEETETALAGGVLHTGDIGTMDQDGYVFLADRIKDLIICGGFNVYPGAVEAAIYRHPSVAEVTVIGVPDDYRGEAPKAFVRLKDATEVGAEELLEFLSDKLARFELPREIEFRDELPKTMIGKLSKKELVAEELAKRADRAVVEPAARDPGGG
jgi:long-chain acyl-CoA synthetase